MNDPSRNDLVSEAYAIHPLSDDRMDAIGRKVRLRTAQSRVRRRLLLAVAVGVGLAATVGFTYPIATANLFGFNVQRNMSAMGAYRVSISSMGEGLPGEYVSKTPMHVLIDGNEVYLANPNSGSKTFGLVGADHRMHTFHQAAKVEVISPANPQMDAFFKLPLTLMTELGRFDMAKRITDRGIKTVHGIRVSEVAISVENDVVIVLDIDPASGVPISMQIPDLNIRPISGASSPIFHLGLRFDYKYDSWAVRKEVDHLKASEGGMTKLDREGDKPRIKKRLFSTALTSNATGRDRLNIYDVRQNPSGDVFVLYSCKGYHQDENKADAWLRLRDENGRSWLTTTINMIFSNLGPKGEGIKAQVFLHPDAAAPLKRARLSIGLDDWEYLSATDSLSKGNRELWLATLEPKPVDCVPDWYFYGFGIRDEIWMTQMEFKLRFQYALAQKKYRRAIQIGLEFDKCLAEPDEPLFFTRADLANWLAKAYRAIGDSKNALACEAQSRGFHEDPKINEEINDQRRYKTNRN